MYQNEPSSDRLWLADWRTADKVFLLQHATGRLAIETVARAGLGAMMRMDRSQAGRLAFAAIGCISAAPEPDSVSNGASDGVSEAGQPGAARPEPRDAQAQTAFEIVQEWSIATGCSAFAVGLSQNAAEALARYRAALTCDRISEDGEAEQRDLVTCWFRAANREAFRAVMMDDGLLCGEDTVAEEMIRIAATTHATLLTRERDARALYGHDEVDAIPAVLRAVGRSSRQAVARQAIARDAADGPATAPSRSEESPASG